MFGFRDGDRDLDRLERELEDLKNDLEQASRKRTRSPIKRAIERETKELFKTEILPLVRARASPHVGDYASRIDDDGGSWTDGSYEHGLTTDSVVVRSHEYGTGQYNINGNGTTNAVASRRSPHAGRVGYRIPSADTAGPVSFEAGGRQYTVDYVVHPGVKPKQFMSRTMDEYEDRIADDVADAVGDAIDRQFE